MKSPLFFLIIFFALTGCTNPANLKNHILVESGRKCKTDQFYLVFAKNIENKHTEDPDDMITHQEYLCVIEGEDISDKEIVSFKYLKSLEAEDTYILFIPKGYGKGEYVHRRRK